LRVDSADPATSTGQTGTVRVSVRTAGLAPGTYRGGITVSVDSGVLRVVNVTLVVAAGAAPATARRQAASPAQDEEPPPCERTKLEPTFVGNLADNFSSNVAGPVPIVVQVLDNCGVPVPNPNDPESLPARVSVEFGVGSPAWVDMDYNGAGNGGYVITWIPTANARLASVTVFATLDALESSLVLQPEASGRAARTAVRDVEPGTATVTGEIQQSPGPILESGNILNAFSRRQGAPLAPGTLVEIYGRNLSAVDKEAAAEAFPLPTELNGARVFIGDRPVPLLFAGPNQINAQIPADLQPGLRYPLSVQVGEAQTVPVQIDIAGSVPGLAAAKSGAATAQHANFDPVTPANPARPGETIILYAVGLGATDPVVAAGEAAPSAEPLARIVAPVQIRLGTASVSQISYAGLVPGLAGLYQINFVMPAGVPPDAADLVVIQAGAVTNTVSLPVGPAN
jgi:uncharacterized protein (TIGR03437 family)